MRQSACLVINSITVYSFAFHCWPCIRVNDRPTIRLVGLFKMVGTGLSLVCCLVIRGSTGVICLLRYFSGIVSHPRVI